MAVEIFKLFGSIFVNNDEANKSIAKTDEKAKGVASTLGNSIKTAAKWSAAIVGGAAAAAGGLVKMAQSSAATADNIDKMSQKIGVSRQAYQELDFICSQSGTSVDKLQNGMKTLRSAMAGAAKAPENVVTIFKKLGVSVKDLDGKMRDSESVMWDTMSALQGIADQDEKAILAQKLFGKSGQELMPLLNSQAGSIDEMKQKAHELGLVMSDELVGSGVGLTDTLDQTKRAFSAIITQLGASFMPIIKSVAEKLQGAMPFIQQAIEKIAPILTDFLDRIMPVLFDAGEKILPILLDLIQQLMPVFEQLASAILPVFLQLIQQLAPFILQFAQQVLPLFVQLIMALMPFIQQIITNILPIFLQIIQQLLPFFIQLVQQILPVIIQLVQTILPPVLKIVETVLPLFLKLFEAVMPLLTTLAEMILPIIAKLLEELSPVIQLLADLLSGVLGQAIESITTLLEPIITILDGIIKFITNIFKGNWEEAWNGIVEAFKGILNRLPAALEGIINGIIWVINQMISGIDWVIQIFDWEIPQIPEVHLPRFRAGIDFVPNDKYLAYLDAGEAVLTASEAEEYRRAKRENGTQSPFKSGESEKKTVNQTFNINVTVGSVDERFDIYDLTDQIVAQISEKLADEVRKAESVYA